MCMPLCDELPYRNRSQLSSSRVFDIVVDDVEDMDPDAEFDADAEFDPDAEPEDVEEEVAIRARAVSIVSARASSTCLALSRDSTRCESVRSSRADELESLVAERVARADDSLAAEADAVCDGPACRYGWSAASGTMTSRVASALMSVRPRWRG